MIRNHLAKIMGLKRLHGPFIKLTYIFAILNWILIPLIPLMGDQPKVEEHAFSSNNLFYYYNASTAEKYREDIKSLDLRYLNATIDYIENVFRKFNIEPYRHEFLVRYVTFEHDVKYQGINTFGIYTAKRGDSSECNLITFDNGIGHKQNDKSGIEISFVLSFLEMLMKNHDKINYISRDIIFLGYDGRYRSQGKAIKEFLDNYYGSKRIGFPRCGTIRQAINIEIDNDNFNRIALHYQGLNGRINDLDYYLTFKDLVKGYAPAFWTIDEDMKVERMVQKFLSQHYYPHAYQISRQLGEVLPVVDFSYTMNMIKTYALSRPDEAHSYIMERGIPAVTLKGHKCQNCIKISEQEALQALGRIVETGNRASMGLQEQLHAGLKTYILVDPDHIIGIKFVVIILIIPISMVLRAIMMGYSQVGDRRFRKYYSKHIATFLALLLVYKCHEIMNWAWKFYKGNELPFCTYMEGGQEGYPEYLFTIWSIVAMVLYLIGVKLFTYLIRSCLVDVEFDKNSFENWQTMHMFQAAFIGLGSILWALSNFSFGLISNFFIVPIFFFLRPIGELKAKTFVSLIIVLAWLVGVGYFGYWWLAGSKYNAIGALRHLLLPAFCNTSDLWRFICFYIFPTLIFIKQILLFRGT